MNTSEDMKKSEHIYIT